jgi:flagellar protein FlbT
MALKLTLKPRESVIIGGAAIQNGATRAELSILNAVPVLRKSDILSPQSVRTPCEGIYLMLQLWYLDGARAEQYYQSYRSLAADVAKAAPSCRRLIARIDAMLAEGRHYQALKCARTLLRREQELLTHVS